MADDDCEVICLSSDDEVTEVKPTRQVVTGMRDDLKQIRSFMSSSTSAKGPTTSQRTFTIPSGGITITKVNGHGPDNPPKPEQDFVDLGGSSEDDVGDDDDEFTIETCREVESRSENEKKREVIDVDDDIQFIDELIDVPSLHKKHQIPPDKDSDRATPVITTTTSATSDSGSAASTANTNGSKKEEDDEGETEEEEEEVDPEAGLSQEEWSAKTKAALDDLILEIEGQRFEGITKKKVEKLRKKFDEGFQFVKNVSSAAHRRLQDEIKEAKRTIVITGRVWHHLLNIFKFMKPEDAEGLAQQSDEARKAARDKELRKLTKEYEKQLMRYQRKIRELEDQEVDWDEENEHNSAYLLEDKCKRKIVSLYYKLCDLLKCTRLTGRPVQCRINVKKHASSGHNEIDDEVDKFINKKGYLECTPDFTEIFDIVTKVNSESGLGIDEESAFNISKKMFSSIVRIIQKRREKDFNMTMLSYLPSFRRRSKAEEEKDEDKDYVEDLDTSLIDAEDPMNLDSELKAKLEENVKQRKSIDDVIKKYAALSENKSPESDQGEDDDEEEDEDDEEEELEGDQEDAEQLDEDESSGINSEKMNSHQYEELCEEEDEEMEVVTGGGGDSPEQEQDQEQDKLTTDCEESEAENTAARREVMGETDDNSSDVNVGGTGGIKRKSEEEEEEVELEENDSPPPEKKVRIEEEEKTGTGEDENSNVKECQLPSTASALPLNEQD